MAPFEEDPEDDSEDAKFWVDVVFKADHLSHVDTVNGQAYVKIDVLLYWHDPRFKGWRETWQVPDRTWGPVLRLHNGIDTRVEQKVFGVHDNEKGLMKRILTYSGPVENSMDLRDFPFDHDNIDVHFRNHSDWMLNGERQPHVRAVGRTYWLRLAVPSVAPDPRHLEVRWDGNVHEWTLRCVTVTLDEDMTSDYYQPFDFWVTFHVSRAKAYWVTKAFVPLYLITLLSFCAFAFDPDDLENRVGTVITCFLAVVSILFVITQFVPKNSRTTTVDKLILLITSLLTVMAFGLSFSPRLPVDQQAFDWAFGSVLAACHLAGNVGILGPAIWRLSRQWQWSPLDHFVERCAARAGGGDGSSEEAIYIHEHLQAHRDEWERDDGPARLRETRIHERHMQPWKTLIKENEEITSHIVRKRLGARANAHSASPPQVTADAPTQRQGDAAPARHEPLPRHHRAPGGGDPALQNYDLDDLGIESDLGNSPATRHRLSRGQRGPRAGESHRRKSTGADSRGEGDSSAAAATNSSDDWVSFEGYSGQPSTRGRLHTSPSLSPGPGRRSTTPLIERRAKGTRCTPAVPTTHPGTTGTHPSRQRGAQGTCSDRLW